MNEQGKPMSRQEKAIQDLMRICLGIQKEEQAVDHMLAQLGEHYAADRCCIFEVNEEEAYISNTWEWCAEGCAAQRGNRQNLPLDELTPWLDWLAEKGECFLSPAAADREDCRVPEFLGADCLMAAPFVVNGKSMGFLGVDTPRRNTEDLLLLSVAAGVSYREISGRHREMEAQGNLIQALAIPYANVYTVNADTREAVCYRMDQAINERYGQKFAAGNYENNIQTYIENDVLEEDRVLFDRVRTVDGVNALLADKKTYYFNYRVSRNRLIQYFQCRLVKPNLKKNEFVIGVKNIDAENNTELAAQRKVEEALAALEKLNAALREESAVSTALSQEYSSLFKIDAKTRKMTLYRTDGIAFDPVLLEKLLALGDYESILSKYIDAFVVPEDRDRLRESIGLSVLMEKVPEGGLYKLGYRRIKDGVISYFEMNLVKTVDQYGAVTLILGLRDVDAEVRRQLKQTRQMEVQREIIEGLGSEYYSVLLVNPNTDAVTVYRAEEAD